MTHACAAYGCGTMISADLAFCPPDWRKLTRPLQLQVNATWQGGRGRDSVEHLVSVARAADYLKATHRNQEGTPDANQTT